MRSNPCEFWTHPFCSCASVGRFLGIGLNVSFAQYGTTQKSERTGSPKLRLLGMLPNLIFKRFMLRDTSGMSLLQVRYALHFALQLGGKLAHFHTVVGLHLLETLHLSIKLLVLNWKCIAVSILTTVLRDA